MSAEPEKHEPPNPGSAEAVAQGCTCPRDQPQAFQGLFWQVEDCPMHGMRVSDEMPCDDNELVNEADGDFGAWWG